MQFDSFRHAIPVLERLESNGYEAYFVGGSVRDALIGRPVGDIDITTSAKPEEVMELFDKVIPVGIEHGTVIVRWAGESYEVTTFRTEAGYADFRHPDAVTFVTNLEEDLKRRDFTINAVAMNKSGIIIDPFGGKQDMEKHLVRAVGNPKERFQEDPLRMMRAVRFVSQLQFQLDPDTFKAICQTSFLMKKIAVERMVIEIEKLFSGCNLQSALELIERTGLWEAIPVWKDNPQLLVHARTKAQPFYSMEEVLAFFILTGKNSDIHHMVKEWKLSNRIKNHTVTLLNGMAIFQAEGLSNWLVYNIPLPLIDKFRRLVSTCYEKGIDETEWIKVYNKLQIKSRQELAVSGKDIIELFPERRKGEWIRETVEKAEYQVVTGNVPNDKKAIKEWVKGGEHPQTTD